MRVALATAGHKAVPLAWAAEGADYLSVSPHDPSKWQQMEGDEIKLVPGLNGFRLEDFAPYLDRARFAAMYAQPCAGKPETVAECVRWVEEHPGWRLGVQAHKAWGLP